LKGHTPAIAVTTDCRIYLAWSQDWAEKTDIFFAWWDGIWWGAQNVSNTNAQSLHPDIAVTSYDAPRIVWAEGTATLNLLPRLYWGQPINGEWGRVFIDDFRGDFPSVIIDTGDRGHLTWQKLVEQRIEIYYTQQREPAKPGQSDVWFNWKTPISDSPTMSSLPQIAMMNGKPTIIWIEKIENQRSIYGSRAVDVWSWTEPEKLSGEHEAKGDPPALAAGWNGPIHIAWADKNPEDAIVYTMLWPSGDGLQFASNSPPELISNGGQNHRKPAIAVSPNNTRVYLVWLEDAYAESTKVYFSESDGRVFNFYIPLIAHQAH